MLRKSPLSVRQDAYQTLLYAIILTLLSPKNTSNRQTLTHYISANFKPENNHFCFCPDNEDLL